MVKYNHRKGDYMKKLYLLFLILFSFMFVSSVYAQETVNSFRCEYNIQHDSMGPFKLIIDVQNFNPDAKLFSNMADLTIQYESNNCSNGKCEMKNYDSNSFNDYKTVNTDDPIIIQFNKNTKKSIIKKGKCDNIYVCYHFNLGGEVYEISSSFKEDLFCKSNTPTSATINGKSQQEVLDPNSDSPKKDLECSYSFEKEKLKGLGHGLKITFKRTVGVITSYEITSQLTGGNCSSQLNNCIEDSTPISNDWSKSYHQELGKTGKYLDMNTEQLKKVLTLDSCLKPEEYYIWAPGTDTFKITTDKSEIQNTIYNEPAQGQDPNAGNGNGKYNVVELDPDPTPMTCSEILGEPLLTIVKGGITIVQIAAAILAIVKGMLILVPAITAKDADGLKKSGKTLAILAVILALVVIFRPLVKMIGHLLDYDVTCIV